MIAVGGMAVCTIVNVDAALRTFCTYHLSLKSATKKERPRRPSRAPRQKREEEGCKEDKVVLVNNSSAAGSFLLPLLPLRALQPRTPAGRRAVLLVGAAHGA